MQPHNAVGDDLTRIASTRVLVVGDLMLDRYWFGDVERISPEAPVPVVEITETEERMGGAGNVARNISALGGLSGLAGIVGDDAAGAALRRIAEDAEISHGLITDDDMTTCVKQRIVARHQQLLRADFEQAPGTDAIAALRKSVDAMIDDYDVVVLSDYGKGALAASQELISLCLGRSKPVLVDPKGADFSRYRGASLITPNLKEFELVAGRINSDEDFNQRAQQLVNSFDLGGLLVTLSERGMKLFRAGIPTLHSPARSREVFDVSGAGDTVIGVMAMCIGAGLEMTDALHYANIAAGVVVSKLGTATASREEMMNAIARELGA